MIADLGVSPDLMMDQIVRAAVQTLAAYPLSLKLLCQIYQARGSLPSDRADLYDEYVLHSLGQSNSSLQWHADLGGRPEFPISDLLRAVRRVAVIVHLSDSPDVDLSGGKGSGLPWQGLAGWETVGVDRIRIEPDLLKAALLTSLFANSGSTGRTFLHRNVGEYLCAGYLVETDRSPRQLRSMILHPAPVSTLPQQLVGVATWMIRLRPVDYAWLVRENPLPLTLSGAVATNDDLRELAARAMLKQPAEHNQLLNWTSNLAALESPAVHALISRGLGSVRQRPLALRMLQDVATGPHIEELSRIALSSRLPIEDRRAAIRLLADAGEARRLTPLVQSPGTLFTDDTSRQARGTLLDSTWPSQMSTSRVLELLVDPPEAFYGSYSVFLSRFERQMSPADAREVINHFASSWDGAPPFSFAGNETDRWERDLLQAAISTVSGSAGDLTSLEGLWKVATRERTWNQLPISRAVLGEEHWRSFLNWAVDVYQAQGQPIPIWGSPSDADGKPTLSVSDFVWLVDRAEHSDEPTRGSIIAIATNLRDFEDPVQNLRVARLTDDAEWHALRVPPTTSNSNTFRRPKREPRDSRGDQLAALRLEIGRAFGDISGFWKVYYLLLSGEGRLSLSPLSIEHLGLFNQLSASEKAKVRLLSDRYLASMDSIELPDPWTPSTIYWSIEAAFAALRYAFERSTDVSPTLAQPTWDSLASPIVAHQATDSGGKSFKSAALRGCLIAAPRALESAVQKLLEAAAASDHPDHRIEDLISVLNVNIVEQLVRFLNGPPNPSSELALRLLTTVHSADAQIWVENTLTTSTNVGQIYSAWSVVVEESGETAIDAFLSIAARDVQLAKEVALRFSARERFGSVLLATPASLLRLWTWLVDTYPPAGDPDIAGVHSVSPREDLGRFRNDVLRRVYESGKADAVLALESLQSERADLTLAAEITAARENVRSNGWTGASADDIVKLLDRSTARIVRSAGELHETVLEQLEILYGWLTQENSQKFALWNANSTFRAPKHENDISDWYSHNLRVLLQLGGVVVNREVEVNRRPASGGGDRNDIRIEYSVPGDHAVEVIEVKGAWNTGVLKNMTTQLLDQYLRPGPHEYGIYLVLWSNSQSASEEAKKRLLRRHTLADLKTKLSSQAAAVPRPFEIAPVVHDLSIT